MSIPFKIHYCWFGGGKLPELAQKCVNSWKKYCPGYEIICWNESNFDINSNRYVREAYDAGKWAFVSDYVRLWAVYKYGGIYFDTDVELIKPINYLLKNGAYMGRDEKGLVSTGLGFAAEPGNAAVGEILKDYDDIHFLLPDGKYDITPCPNRNTEVLKRLGISSNGGTETVAGITILPQEYLCPMCYDTGKVNITDKTVSIHHYYASWISPAARRTTRIKRIIGVRLYEKLYGKFLHKFKWLEW